MDILEIIKNRRSVRAFQQKKIPEEVVEKLMEALIWAPSAGNLQSRKFYFIFHQGIKEKLVEASFGQNFVAQAPLVIIGCTNDKITSRYGERGKNLYSICDVATSLQNMMLLAYSEGLGTCWIGKFDEEKTAQILNLPDNLRPVVITPVGSPAEEPKTPARVSKEETIKILK